MFFFFFNDTATTEIYTLSLHDALPISDVPDEAFEEADQRRGVHRPVEHHPAQLSFVGHGRDQAQSGPLPTDPDHGDRKSTRLNSSHANISYAVFCLKKKKI